MIQAGHGVVRLLLVAVFLSLLAPQAAHGSTSLSAAVLGYQVNPREECSLDVEFRIASQREATGKCGCGTLASDSLLAARGGVRTTAHGAERIAGQGATRGGVLSEAGVNAVRHGGRVMTQADGATVRILQNEAGRFNVVIEGERGIITTFENLSQKSLDRLGGNYGWR